MRATHLALGLLTTIALSFTALPGNAQSWPTQVVKIITPFPPGSGGDVTARPFAEKLTERWRKPVIVENRPGADGIIAATAVLNSNDGHTLLYTKGAAHEQPARARGQPSVQSQRSARAAAAGVYVAIGVPASLATSSLSEFVARARLKKGQLGRNCRQSRLSGAGVSDACRHRSRARPIQRSEHGDAGPRARSTPLPPLRLSCRWRKPARSR